MAILETYQDAVAELGAVESMWNPFQLIYFGDAQSNNWGAFLHSMQNIGLMILVLMAALKFVKMFMDELNGIPALTALLGVAVEMSLVAVFLLNYTWFAEIFPLLFHRLTRIILDSYDADMMRQVVTSLQAVGGEKSEEAKWFSLNALLASVPNIISTAMAGLALALYWVMSKYQAVLYTFWYLIGPLLLPFYIYPPFRGVAERWFGSLLGASFMGVVGAIMYLLMVRMQWMTKAFASGASSSYMASMVFSILLLLLMISIPKLSNSIWHGISASMAQAVASASLAGGAITAVAVGSAGAALQTTGTTVRTGAGVAGMLNRYAETTGSGMGAAARLRDAVTNRDSYLRKTSGQTLGEKIMAGTHRGSTAVRDIGHDFLMSQMPKSIRNLDSTLQKGHSAREKEAVQHKDQNALRDYVASKVGPDKANSMAFPAGWQVRPGINQSYEEALKTAGERLVKNFQRAETASGVRAEAARLIGSEKAQALVIPEFFNLKPRPGQTPQQAMAAAAEGLLRKQHLIDEKTQTRMDHSAIMDYALKKLGPEKAGGMTIPTAWRVKAKKGQSRQQAVEGSATALFQELGLIDRKAQNAIAKRYGYSQARKNKSPSPDNKGTESA